MLVDLYEREYEPLVRAAFVLVGSRHIAEEVVQDAVLALQQRWQDAKQPAAYLRISVLNGARGVLRRRALAEREAPDPESATMPSEMVELRDALLSLKWEQRSAIVLRFVLDLDDVEIASLLGCRRATVRSHVARGLARLRREVSR
jgi:RNA polymerase sigma factor (sigma-70 family)